MKTYRIGICGGSGYTGIELLKWLTRHPAFEVVFVTSESQAGKTIGSCEPYLFAYTDMVYITLDDATQRTDIDLVFLALPHEASAKVTPQFLAAGIKVVDLSAAYRIKNQQVFEKAYGFTHPSFPLTQEAVYGLPELSRESICQARLVANPGCYPTSILLPLIPLFKAGLIQNSTIIADSKSGFSGRGRKTDIPGLFSEMNENFYAYSVGNHRHHPEIVQELEATNFSPVSLIFTPHIMPIDRGMLSTIYVPFDTDPTQDIYDLWTKTYKDSPFVRIFRGKAPQIKWVQNTNEIHMSFTYLPSQKMGIILSSIDNLVKGASGQAIQNANLMVGLPDTLGLITQKGV
ncbi:N-acetyl-gamma-glutamyl-phosphate reductase [Thermospira aquatica]|uniref:N-acetyl-gamma-glutamyl-phosphate reductase n=1 Tax=Thermospira aquatica TaxID=2828656 RepID=A0AAX3BGM2_9SPIR|nr:N-acetyl-gamma-glutamyl-phosphate reductase [Thermospira aquatica]URA11305.1 N-acetyl-gamma-glutamyl-phosphate reductase [Thermospira aquatica]